MRRHIAAVLVLLLLAFVETSVLPFALGPLVRPNLVLIVSGTWASMRRGEGFVWALGGGMALDILSSAPFGTHATALALGHLAALALDRLPLPAEFFRATNWVAVSTLVFHLSMLAVFGLAGRPFDLGLALTQTVLPLMAINPVLSLLAYAALSPVDRELEAQERFAR